MSNPPKWFLPVCVLALLWNLAGLAAIIADARLSPADIAALPAAQQAMYAARPGWSVVASFAAVLGGTLGSIALLLRRNVAIPLFWVSLIGLLVQDFALFFVVGRSVTLGVVPAVLQGLVLLIAVALLVLSRRARASGWFHPTSVS